MNPQYITGDIINGGTLPEVTIPGRSSGGWMDVLSNVLKTILGGISTPQQQPVYTGGNTFPGSNPGSASGGGLNPLTLVLIVILILILTKTIKI